MVKKIKIVFFLLLFLSTNLSFSKVSLSADSWGELIGSLDELKGQIEFLPKKDYNFVNSDYKSINSGFFDKYINRLEDKFDVVRSVLGENKKFIKLSSFTAAFIYCYYINPNFLPNLVEKSATTAIRYLSLFIESLFKGAFVGVWDNKGIAGKIIGGLMLYSIFNNVFSIGIKSMAEYYIEGRKQRAINEMDKRFGKIK